MTTDGTPRHVLLLPSPLLPASVLDDLRDALVGRGLTASVAPARLSPGQSALDLVRRWAAAAAAGADTVLVAHSNAGLLAPHVRAGGAPGCPIVFMDAALPPADGSHALAPEPFRAWLGELADADGSLPPWTRWWRRSDIDGVIPTERFDAIDGACPRLPLAYFDTRLTVPTAWAEERNAYLAFGDTYAEERAFAAQHRWPLADLAGSHLAFVTRPDDVAAAVTSLVRDLTG